ncbi:MAG: hypothetical protein L6V93_07145 [Clostridiales bacterium]|nr:MAG: hypothetical protein L6V93_07145 [Clostridiales bacterium]
MKFLYRKSAERRVCACYRGQKATKELSEEKKRKNLKNISVTEQINALICEGIDKKTR